MSNDYLEYLQDECLRLVGAGKYLLALDVLAEILREEREGCGK